MQSAKTQIFIQIAYKIRQNGSLARPNLASNTLFVV
jgi:hypothetical protein